MSLFAATLADTSYDMELEKLKNKIKKLYMDLAAKTFKAANPGATPEQLQKFLEENGLEFKEAQGFEEEADGLEKILELLSQDEDLDKVADKDYEKADVETRKELKSKSKDKSTVPPTEAIEAHTGGLFFSGGDRRVITLTKALRTPRGTLKRTAKDSPKVYTRSLQDIWDAEREKLLKLVKKRNKEHGVKF